MKKRLKLKPLSPGGILLKEVWALHRGFRPKGSLDGNVGDGFLVETNPVYGRVRAAFLRRGFRFTKEDFCHYYAYPLLSLDHLIEARRVPYLDNAHWLRRLAEETSFSLDDLKAGELKFNYLFHESAHCLAHDAFFGRRSFGKLPRTKATLWKILAGEALANTSEALCAAFVEGEMASFFLDANCHFRSSGKEAKALLSSAKRHGWLSTAKGLWGSFLYANFLYDRLGSAEKRLLARWSGLPVGSPVLRIGTELSVPFRINTTPLHLRKMGFPDLKYLEIGSPLRASPKDLRTVETLLQEILPL